MSEGIPAKPEIVEVETDVLIVGGGMACCGTAFEAVRWAGDNVKVTLVDKATLERSGAVAQGLSAINTYLGDNDPADYVRMVANDLMGITRDDLVFDVGRTVDDSVHLFEDWGLPIWKDKESEGVALRDGGKPVRSGRWQIMINGESYKPIVAEPARTALGLDNIYERVFIVKLLLDKTANKIAGAAGFSVRENKIYIFKAKAVVVGAGGAVNVFRPRSVGEGQGRAWYPIWNAGSSFAMQAEVGAEMTMMENRFVPGRFKDGYGPVGAWFLLFKAKATNAYGENYMVKNKELLDDYPPYGSGKVPPTCLRNHLMLEEMRQGRGPVFMDTPGALAALYEGKSPKEVKHIEAEAWEDFLDMCIGQAGLWAGMNVRPEDSPSEIMPTEPYLMGSHSGCCGMWVSGPEDLNSPDDWKWGYNRMTTVQGLFTCGDGVGASGHKFSSGSHAEGRVCGKEAVRFAMDNPAAPDPVKSTEEVAAEIWKPVNNFLEHKDKTTDIDVNPHYISPRNLQFRLQKLMDEYVAGISTYYTCNEKSLEVGLELLTMTKEDSANMRAKDLHELLRAWENDHRIITAEAHLRHIQFRKESRYPGFYYRTDFPKLDEENWKVFVNSKINQETGVWDVFTRPHVDLVPKNV
jgi:adenylylsulfate reductase, subunit A